MGEYAPNIFLRSELILLVQLLDLFAQITSSAIFHIKIQLLSGLEMLSMVITDNVWVFERIQDRKFGMELLSLLLRHFDVLDLFST